MSRDFVRHQLIQAFLIEEIEATNRIESIQSTRHDIFSIMNQVRVRGDKKLLSIVNSYELLLAEGNLTINTLSDISKTYSDLTRGAISSEDEPDGRYFRRGSVYVTDGMDVIHSGVQGEKNIESAMAEFLKVYNSDMNIFERMIIGHFLIETIHPYYDGNGRLGRYLFSQGVYNDTGSISAFLISKALAQDKQRYYAALRSARDKYQFGCINNCVRTIANMLQEAVGETLARLQSMLRVMKYLPKIESMTKSESAVYELLAQGSILSDFGLNNTEIHSHTGLAKRTIINAINHFRQEGLIMDIRVGRHVYHYIPNLKE